MKKEYQTPTVYALGTVKDLTERPMDQNKCAGSGDTLLPSQNPFTMDECPPIGGD